MKYFLSFFVSLLCLQLAMAQVDLNLGLRAYYPFNGNTNDASGNGLNATQFNGVQLTTDRFGNTNSAYYFDGIDDYMKVADNGALSTPAFSICYYFNTEINSYQNCIGKINYTNGNGATYNSGIFQSGPLLILLPFLMPVDVMYRYHLHLYTLCIMEIFYQIHGIVS
ncbi:MAG: hypothetical protein QM737_00795 [Ferruginibacter sp.]